MHQLQLPDHVGTFDPTPNETIARLAALAEALGVDLNDDVQVGTRQAHKDANTACMTAVDPKPGLQVLG